MRMNRRHFIGLGMAAAGAAVLGPARLLAQTPAPELRPMTEGVVPISGAEHLARIARAQELMRANGLTALLIEPGASMTYFSGVQWWRSERLTALILPLDGEPAVVTPHFEEPSV